jgi:hypothetical protein
MLLSVDMVSRWSKEVESGDMEVKREDMVEMWNLSGDNGE